VSLYEKRMIVHADGSVEFPGIDHSNGARPLAIVAYQVVRRGHDGERRYVVVRHPGGKCWAGVGVDRTTVPVHFMVLRLVERVAKATWKVEDVVEVRPREHVEALFGAPIRDLLE